MQGPFKSCLQYSLHEYGLWCDCLAFLRLNFHPTECNGKTSINFSGSRAGYFGSSSLKKLWRERGSTLLWQKNIAWVAVVWRDCSNREEASVLALVLCISKLGVFPGPWSRLLLSFSFSLQKSWCFTNIAWKEAIIMQQKWEIHSGCPD